MLSGSQAVGAVWCPGPSPGPGAGEELLESGDTVPTDVPPIHAVVLDLDGTLLDNAKRISPRNVRALERCAEAGIAMLVATARPPRSVRPFLPALPFIEYAAYYNGALVMRGPETVVHTAIPRALSGQVTRFIREDAPHALLSYEAEDAWYTGDVWPDAEATLFRIGSASPRPKRVDDAAVAALSPTKILVHGYHSWDRLSVAFPQSLNVIATDGGRLVQVMNQRASKEAAVRWMLSVLGVLPDNVLALGDDVNDLGVFHLCGFPVAMANAVPELKAVARVVTASNEDDGVACALERFVLHGEDTSRGPS